MKKKVWRYVARIYCKGCQQSKLNEDQASCKSGCIACGACVSACKRQAVTIAKDGVAVVDEEKCVGCGLCIKACPQGIIHKNIADQSFFPQCANKSSGITAKQECDNSCIACGLCEKNCPMGAITIADNHAVIDEEKCTDCGFCLVKCPRNVIIDARGILVKNDKKGRM